MGSSIFLSDLDGTLLNSEPVLTQNTVEILNRLMREGLRFTYATARSFTSARRVTGALELTLPVATYNGAVYVDPATGAVLETNFLDEAAFAPLRERIERGRLTPLVYSVIDGRERVSWLADRQTPSIANYVRSRGEDVRLRPAPDYRALFAGDVFYLTFIENREDAFALRSLFGAYPSLHAYAQQDNYNPDEYWMEVSRHDVSKAGAVRKFRAQFRPESVICFGDNLNDEPMFRACDACYAVRNAQPELRAIATGIIGGNDEDGVARWLEENWRR